MLNTTSQHQNNPTPTKTNDIKSTIGFKIAGNLAQLQNLPLGFHYSYEKPEGEFEELYMNVVLCCSANETQEERIKWAGQRIADGARKIINLLDVSSVELTEDKDGNAVLKAKIYRRKV